jgi:hypothetical protein
MGDELSQPPKQLIKLGERIRPRFSAVDSHGNVVIGELWGDNSNVISRIAGSKVVKLPGLSEDKVFHQGIAGLAVDKNNNVYVVRWLRTEKTENSDVELSYVLNVLDENTYIQT